MSRIRQLALPFPQPPSLAMAEFLPAPSNQAALAWLRHQTDWPGRRLALWGGAGCGKTHLLHLWARGAGAVLWSGPAVAGLPPLPAQGGIAIDDADAAADETSLLHLLNATAEAGLPILLAGREPPARWPVRLPDLASRLRTIQAAAILPPEESLLRAMLVRLLAECQLMVPEALQDWLLLRLPRDGAALAEAVRQLDQAALANGVGITRSLATAVLDLAGRRLNIHEDLASDAIGPAAPPPPR